MNRAIVSLVLALLFAFPSFAQEKPDIMRVGVSSVAPFVIEEKGGKLKGFDIEVGDSPSISKFKLASCHWI